MTDAEFLAEVKPQNGSMVIYKVDPETVPDYLLKKDSIALGRQILSCFLTKLYDALGINAKANDT